MTEYHLQPAEAVAASATVAALQASFDVHWFGAPEQSEAEVAEELGQANSLVLVSVAGSHRAAAAAWMAGEHTHVVVDPQHAPQAVIAVLSGWLADHPGSVQVLDRDERLQHAFAEIGWTHRSSAFELTRDTAPLPRPDWPAGIRVSDRSGADPVRLYDLIYRRAGWTEIEGHQGRDLDSWISVFLTERDLPEQQVLAFRGDRVVGAALGRIFDDGVGWVAQLAVDRDERRQGLGRALLLDAFRRRIEGGARQLGLGVMAANSEALSLYRAVGLAVDREWQIWSPPR